MRRIKLFWWRQEQQTNFGDELSPLIVRQLTGAAVVRASMAESDLVAAGSVLQKLATEARLRERANPLFIWGSGLIKPRALTTPSCVRFAAVRGPLTRETLNLPSETLLGDPALLCNRLFPVPRTARYSWGVVPHFRDIDNPLVREIVRATPRSVLIDVRNPDVLETLRIIASCERIASTSLHGLIVADAFRIPNVRVLAGRIHASPNWKFSDYAGSTGRKHLDPAVIPNSGNLEELEHSPDTTYFGGLERLEDKLASSFPWACAA